jgi:hypothetical protein
LRGPARISQPVADPKSQGRMRPAKSGPSAVPLHQRTA